MRGLKRGVFCGVLEKGVVSSERAYGDNSCIHGQCIQRHHVVKARRQAVTRVDRELDL